MVVVGLHVFFNVCSCLIKNKQKKKPSKGNVKLMIKRKGYLYSVKCELTPFTSL